MINPRLLSKADAGRPVVYISDHGAEELGVLVGWSDEWLFVRFRGPGGEGCCPRNVSFITDDRPEDRW